MSIWKIFQSWGKGGNGKEVVSMKGKDGRLSSWVAIILVFWVDREGMARSGQCALSAEKKDQSHGLGGEAEELPQRGGGVLENGSGVF